MKVATVRAVKLMWADYPGIPDISEIHFFRFDKIANFEDFMLSNMRIYAEKGWKGGGKGVEKGWRGRR